MDIATLQQQLFTSIRTRAASTGSLADELAALLQVSSDSAYRRIRGEKLVTLEELYLLATHYRLSLDQLMGLQPGGILFHGQYIDSTNFRFENYIADLVRNMGYINSFNRKEMYYVCKDMPIFHHYHLREIAAFKWFFWLKTYFQFPEFATRKFSFDDYPDALYQEELKALQLYAQIPSVEIWNIESMNIIFRQIDFYREAQLFTSGKDLLRLYEAVLQTWGHLERQATLGFKFQYGDPEEKPLAGFRMYFNEVLLGDNSLLAIMDEYKASYLIHSSVNFMVTRDVQFNENMYQYLQNQIRRSTLISKVSEKERAKFFRIVRERILKRMEAIGE